MGNPDILRLGVRNYPRDTEIHLRTWPFLTDVLPYTWTRNRTPNHMFKGSSYLSTVSHLVGKKSIKLIQAKPVLIFKIYKRSDSIEWKLILIIEFFFFFGIDLLTQSKLNCKNTVSRTLWIIAQKKKKKRYGLNLFKSEKELMGMMIWSKSCRGHLLGSLKYPFCINKKKKTGKGDVNDIKLWGRAGWWWLIKHWARTNHAPRPTSFASMPMINYSNK